MPIYKTLSQDSTTLQIATFASVAASEHHVVVRVSDTALPFPAQCRAVLAAALEAERLTDAVPVFARFFLSDAANQESVLRSLLPPSSVAVSVVQQPPLDRSKLSLWLYLMSGTSPVTLPSGLTQAVHGSYRHLWTAGNRLHEGDSLQQGERLFLSYVDRLAAARLTLSSDCVRTWLFVNDIDNNYQGVVTARNRVFARQGLTSATHFIASTGIGGRGSDPASLVQLDAYAVGGLRPGQLGYLYASSNFNRTSDYGVSFERGATLQYGDRLHIFISGTASIDNKGEILHPRDIEAQTRRMLLNIEALLREAGSSLADLSQAVVYLRDASDYDLVNRLLRSRLPAVPLVIVGASVCRPGWLIEMECMAVRPSKADFPDF